jgi:hypothetical protein
MGNCEYIFNINLIPDNQVSSQMTSQKNLRKVMTDPSLILFMLGKMDIPVTPALQYLQGITSLAIA